jgi:hypothetical protein
MAPKYPRDRSTKPTHPINLLKGRLNSCAKRVISVDFAGSNSFFKESSAMLDKTNYSLNIS